jgi:S-DNA-T family DNA segregation ATPase FtsK/SpoIIIE
MGFESTGTWTERDRIPMTKLRDPLFEDAVRLTIEARKGSTSVLQRGLKIGYARAVQLIDLMEQEGIVGPQNGFGPRKVLRRRA